MNEREGGKDRQKDRESDRQRDMRKIDETDEGYCLKNKFYIVLQLF